jgi:putative DNA primase/helicase
MDREQRAFFHIGDRCLAAADWLHHSLNTNDMAWGKQKSKSTAGKQTKSPHHGLVVTRAADLKPERLARVWNGRFHRGKIAIVVGEPGVGKGQLAVFMAAKVSTGGEWPGGNGTASRGDVVYITAEDRGADTIRPRLEAAGADLKRVHIVEGVNDHFGRRPFNLVTDLSYVSELLGQVRKPRLVMVDPTNACLSSTDVYRFNPNSVTQVRALLRQYEDLADQHRVAMVFLTHFTKSNRGSVLSRVTGSFAFVAAARSVFTVERKHDDTAQRVFAPAKNNLGPEAPPLVFRIEERPTTDGTAPVAVFCAD